MCGVVVGRWVVAALGKSEFGLCGVVGGMMMIDLLACTMRLDRGRFAAMMNVGRTYTVKHIQKGPMEVQRLTTSD